MMEERTAMPGSLSDLTRAAGVGVLDEWRLARSVRANVLIVGGDETVGQLMARLGCDVGSTVVWHPGRPLSLPPIEYAGTVILHGISGMSDGDQQRLHEWVEVNGGRSHVVSTTAQPLVPLIESGTFLEPLYYRLNIVCVGLGDAASA